MISADDESNGLRQERRLPRPDRLVLQPRMDTAAETADGLNRKGLNLAYGGHFAEAVESFRLAAELEPAFAEVHNNLGAALLSLKEYSLAVSPLKRAVELEPGNIDAAFNLGIANWKTGHPVEARTLFLHVVTERPDFADAHHNLGILLAGERRYTDAAEHFRRVAALRPSFAAAHLNLGISLAYLKRHDEAIASLTRAIRCEPGNALARAQRMYLLSGNCDWEALRVELSLIPNLGITTGAIPPFGMLAFEDAPHRHLARARHFAEANYKSQLAPIGPVPEARPERLKIGYFSGDFGEHAVMQVAAPLFEEHDRNRFSIHAYSYGPAVDSPMRRRLAAAFDSFQDVSPFTDAEVASTARADGLDIAVDLQGHTLHSRLGIFANRAAPIQVTHLGFPGSTGASFMDYLIADETVVTNANREAFSEALILMPNCYQPNGRRLIAATRWTREMAGLPSEAFVFCCFNNSYKITPREFDIWMRLLKRVEGSVLWLVEQNRHVVGNLRKEAARRHVHPDRLVFAPRVSIEEYLARQRLADLSLDTLAYNGHSTGSDNLWAGLPLVTMAGNGFASRVGASLLRAVGLPDLVTSSEEEYEALATELATDRERLAKVRARLADSLATSPLFDAPLYARHLEAGFDLAFDRLSKGMSPADIRVAR